MSAESRCISNVLQAIDEGLSTKGTQQLVHLGVARRSFGNEKCPAEEMKPLCVEQAPRCSRPLLPG
jgi:hypothetical protein